MKNFVYLTSDISLFLDETKCSGCSMCINVCPHNVFEIECKKAIIKNLKYCMECGACSMNCPEQAISVKTGVGCAAAVISGMLGKTSSDCCCSTKESNCC